MLDPEAIRQEYLGEIYGQLQRQLYDSYVLQHYDHIQAFIVDDNQWNSLKPDQKAKIAEWLSQLKEGVTELNAFLNPHTSDETTQAMYDSPEEKRDSLTATWFRGQFVNGLLNLVFFIQEIEADTL